MKIKDEVKEVVKEAVVSTDEVKKDKEVIDEAKANVEAAAVDAVVSGTSIKQAVSNAVKSGLLQLLKNAILRMFRK